MKRKIYKSELIHYNIHFTYKLLILDISFVAYFAVTTDKQTTASGVNLVAGKGANLNSII